MSAATSTETEESEFWRSFPVYKSARLTGPEIAAELSEAVGQELGPPEEDQRAGLTR